MQTNELNGSFFSRVNARLSQLTKQERRAVDFIQGNRDGIIHLSITDLALQSRVSESTLTRLCVKLGYPGFQAMKISIAQEVVNSQAKIHEELSPDDSPQEIIDKVFESSVQALQMTRAILGSAEIAQSISALTKANKIVIIGSGNSGSVAMDAHHKFLRLGLNAHGYTDSHMQMIAVSGVAVGDVVMGISHSGSSVGIKQALAFAKSMGATTISITSYGISPLSQISDIRLHTNAREVKYRSYAISSRLAELAIIDTLYTGIALSKGESAIDNFERLEHALTVTKF